MLPNVAPNIMNMALLGWLEVGDVGSVILGVICDTPAGFDVGEDVGSGAEDEGEPEGEPEGRAKTDKENSSAVKLQYFHFFFF